MKYNPKKIYFNVWIILQMNLLELTIQQLESICIILESIQSNYDDATLSALCIE